MEESCGAKKRTADPSEERPEGEASESRRDALQRFGRFAAAAPTAMLLLGPREGHAGKAKAKAKGRDDDYD